MNKRIIQTMLVATLGGAVFINQGFCAQEPGTPSSYRPLALAAP